MESVSRRKPRTVSLNDQEFLIVEKLRELYGMRSISEVIRYLIIRDVQQLNEDHDLKKAGENGDL